ncbi:MAG: transporter [Halanaeroarchaeum sp.]
MATIGTLASILHVVFGGAWAGTVVFVALLAGDLDGSTDLGKSLLDRLRLVSRSGAAITFLTGGVMAAGYSHSYFLSAVRGWVLAAMVLLWFVLMVLVEVGAARGLDGGRSGTAVLRVAGVVAGLLLLDVGVLLGAV